MTHQVKACVLVSNTIYLKLFFFNIWSLIHHIGPCSDYACGPNQISVGNLDYDETRHCITDICECIDGFFNLHGICVGEIFWTLCYKKMRVI